MAPISMFYGLIIYLYHYDNIRHHTSHIHVKYQGEWAVLSEPCPKLKIKDTNIFITNDESRRCGEFYKVLIVIMMSHKSIET
jgi:hypothetical protein